MRRMPVLPLWLSMLMVGFATSAVRAAVGKPNIVLIMTDDMGFSDIGCYGGEISTPNLDRLAEGGIRFSQFYNCGKCEPSRAALVTGQQWWSYSPNVAVRRDSPNFGEVLRGAGYRTMMVGKWHAAGVPFHRGFHRHFGFMGGGTDYFLGDDSFTLHGKERKRMGARLLNATDSTDLCECLKPPPVSPTPLGCATTFGR